LILTIVKDIVVDHWHSGTPKPTELRGEYPCLEVSSEEYSELSDDEVRKLTRRWSYAYTLVENGAKGKFYLRLTPRWRYMLSVHPVFSLTDLRRICSITDSPHWTISGCEAYELLRFVFHPVERELMRVASWHFETGKRYIASYAGYKIKFELPPELVRELESRQAITQKVRESLQLIDRSMFIGPS